MPKGPQGQKYSADVIGCAVAVAKIATNEVVDTRYAVPNHRRSGKAGPSSRARKLIGQERSGIAKKAAQARWS